MKQRTFTSHIRTYLFPIILLVTATATIGCPKAPYDRDKMEALLQGKHPPAFHEYTVGERSIHYAAVGKRDTRPVIFIHGTPGSWHAFAEYMADDALAAKAYLISVDRPGFGKSGHKQMVTSLKQQAVFLQPLLHSENGKEKAILVGHSLGAPIAARLAMDYPELVGAMVLVAPSLDPDLEKPRWYNKLAASSLINWAVPDELALANVEIMPLEQELRDMLPLWKTIKIPVVVIQGEKDSLVSPGNADFAQRVLNSSSKVIRVPEAGHFVLWRQPQIIRKEILTLLDSTDLPPGKTLSDHF
jgi:pimeloyl-ACP methyl ester carboxylesterase